mgnify:CR=1 FL=1
MMLDIVECMSSIIKLCSCINYQLSIYIKKYRVKGKIMPEFTPFEKDKLFYEALVEAVGAVKAQQIIEKMQREYAMIKNASNIEIR